MSASVSILVNNFNYGRFLIPAVQSGLAQTHRDLELIVVDDGSTDDSVARLATVKDHRLKVIEQPNGGQAAAYNAGFAACRGDYVLFLDSDDLLDPDAVEQALAAFAPDVVKVQFAMRVIDVDGLVTGTVHPPEMDDSGLIEQVETFGTHASPPGTGNVFRRTFLDQIMPVAPETAFRSAADTWLIMMAPFYGRVVSRSAIGGSYRVHVRAQAGEPLVIGNANANPISNLEKTVRTCSITLEALASRGLTAATVPSLPAPWTLRAWALARLIDPARAPRQVYGRSLSLRTIVQSVWRWGPYRTTKRIAYGSYLIALTLPPAPISRRIERLRNRLLTRTNS